MSAVILISKLSADVNVLDQNKELACAKVQLSVVEILR